MYGDMRLESASVAEEGAEKMELSQGTSSIEKRLLQWAVQVGALHRRTVSAVQSDIHVLSTYFLTVDDEGMEWKKNVQ